MKPIEPIARSVSTPRTGLATLRGLLSARGIGAPKTRIATPLIAGLALLAFATISAQAETCPNEAFRTGPSAHLPDCRAYEQVSPPVKDAAAAELLGAGSTGSSALLGVYAAVGGLEGFPDAGTLGPTGYYSTQRTASGWTLEPDDPPSSEYLTTGYGANSDFADASEDGLSTVWIDRGVSRPENSLDLYARRPDRSIVDIGPLLPPSAPPEPPTVLHREAHPETDVSADASHVFFTLLNFRWPGDETAKGTTLEPPSLYEYVGTGNTTPLLVAVDNQGAEIGQCGNHLAGQSEGENSGSMSANGDVAVFTVQPTHECEEAQVSGSGPPVVELFVRLNNGQPQSPLNEQGECTVAADACTVAISEPSKADCAACDTEASALTNPRYLGVSEDGSKVFFSTEQDLLPGAVGTNIYEYDFDAPPGDKVVRVSAGDATVSDPAPELEAPAFTRVVSEDGSHVYFVAKGVLTRTPNGDGQSAEAGTDNLYVFNTETGTTAFIAQTTLDQYNGGQNAEADVTPNGQFLVFTSSSDLTRDDTSTAAQVFEYDAQTGALARISVGQEGFNHNGNVTSTIFNQAGAEVNSALIHPSTDGYSIHSWNHSSVSVDGSYVFFESIVGLTPQAFNEKAVGYRDQFDKPIPAYAENVYEYHDGRVSLISDGRDVGVSNSSLSGSIVELTGTDASGADVFFRTVDPLVGQDTDTDIDIYDARVAGGFPAPVAPSSCTGEECQGALSGAPTLLSPGSEFQAGGNPPLAEPVAAKPAVKPKAKSAKCKKGFMKKKGKCVKTKAKAKKASRARRAGR